MACPSSSFESATIIPFHILESVPKLLLLLSASPDISEGIFTNFSHEPTWRWYFAMTPFEAFFLGIIITQFAVLNLLGIFPLNLSALVNGMPNGRKKRETFPATRRKRDIASQLLKLMKKLDPDECSFKSICELELESNRYNNNHTEIPQSISAVLSGLKQITKKRQRGEISFHSRSETLPELVLKGVSKEDDNVISLYEEAVMFGDRMQMDQSESESPCKLRYPKCPVNSGEILEYAKMIESVDNLFDF